MNPVIIHFFGGPCDGDDKHFAHPPHEHAARIPGSRRTVLYVPSQAWSEHFKRSTFVPEGFPGLPPKPELQAA